MVDKTVGGSSVSPPSMAAEPANLSARSFPQTPQTVRGDNIEKHSLERGSDRENCMVCRVEGTGVEGGADSQE